MMRSIRNTSLESPVEVPGLACAHMQQRNHICWHWLGGHPRNKPGELLTCVCTQPRGGTPVSPGPGLTRPLLCSRCGWMLPLRSSFPLVLASGSYWLLLATTNSTTTATSEYQGPPQAKLKSGVSVSQPIWRKAIKPMASNLAGLGPC